MCSKCQRTRVMDGRDNCSSMETTTHNSKLPVTTHSQDNAAFANSALQEGLNCDKHVLYYRENIDLVWLSIQLYDGW